MHFLVALGTGHEDSRLSYLVFEIEPQTFNAEGVLTRAQAVHVVLVRLVLVLCCQTLDEAELTDVRRCDVCTILLGLIDVAVAFADGQRLFARG